MSTQVARVRAKARPWRLTVLLLLTLAAAVAAEFWGVHGWDELTDPKIPGTQKIITATGCAAFVIFGAAAAFELAGKSRSLLQPVIGQAHAGVVRYAIVLVGLFVILFVALRIGHVPVTQLVVGGAVTGILLGIAAQQSLANVFAGLVLLFARPFRVGDRVRFRAGALSGQVEGFVTDVSLTYVRLETDEGRVLLPNALVLAAAVLLVPDAAAADQADPADAATPRATA
jgi:small-conductance mechanosensitive channel